MRKRFLLISIATLISVSIFFRVWQLGNIPGMNGDEAWLGIKAMNIAHGKAVNWKTNTGNFSNPFYLIPLAGFHAVFPPSYALIRVVAVISGILLLPLNFFLCRRVYDCPTALVSTLLLAVLPINIIYSRFGWEPSQSVLASLPVLYGALAFQKASRRALVVLVLTIFSLGVALLVHPSNFYLITFIAAAVIWKKVRGWSSPWRFPVFIAAICLVLVALAFVAYRISPQLAREAMAQRVTGFPWSGQWLPALSDYLRLFSGMNVYRHVAGSCEWTSPLLGNYSSFHWWDMVAFLLFVAAVFSLFREYKKRKISDGGVAPHSMDFVLIVSGLFGLLLFFALSGPGFSMVRYERYVLWIIAPGVLLLSRGAVAAWGQARRFRVVLPGGLCLCVTLLAGFYFQYFQFIRSTGAQTVERTYRTGAADPKAEAMRYILATVPSEDTLFIIAPDWFVKWPMDYTARTEGYGRKVECILNTNIGDPQMAAQLEKAQQEGRVFFAEFSDSEVAGKLREGLVKGHSFYREKTFADYAGRPAVSIFLPKVWDS